MTLLRFLLLTTTIGILASCTKEDITTDENEKANPVKEEQVIDYLPLEVGAYWVFQGKTTDLNTGESSPIGKHDSLYISKDTLIASNQYFIIEGTRLGNQVRVMVSPAGTDLLGINDHLIFSLDRYNDPVNWPSTILPDGVEKIETTLRSATPQSIPLGTFDAILYDITLQYPEENSTYQNEPIVYESNWIGKGIGPVKFSRLLPVHNMLIEMELVRTSVY